MSYRGVDFLAPDNALHIWMKLIVDSIDARDQVPAWLAELREDWFIQATEDFGFGVVPDLDMYVVDDERRDVLLAMCREAMTRLGALGDPLTVEALNSVGVTKESSPFTRGDAEGVVRDTAETFVALLSGGPVHHIG